MKRFIAGLIAVCVVVASFSPAVAGAETTNKYAIAAKLNYERGTLDVREMVAYTNRTPKALISIVFNVTPAYFRAFSLKAALVDGTPVETRMDGVVMEVPLPKPLEPRATTRLMLDFTLDLPEQGGRFGINEKVVALGNWYPILAVYMGDNWDRHQYSKIGDPFFTEVADYDVTLEVSAPVKVAHSGELVEREGNIWRMHGDRIREFALAISDRYETRSVDVGGVELTAFYLPEHRPAGAMYLEAGALATKWFSEKFGAYPNKSLHLAETVSTSSEMVGQEYPGVVFISSSEADKAGGMTGYLAYLVAHEIGHQWFYSLVGNDQINDPWMDEALATYLSYQALGWAPLTLNSPSVVASGNSPVSMSNNDSSDDSRYTATVYGKGAVFLQELNTTMKSENFYKFLRRYVELYRDKVATPRDFFSLAQSYSTANLNPLIKKYFAYPEFKGDAVPRLDVEWPQAQIWTESVTIGFETNAQVRQTIVDADGRVLLTQDDPSSPLSVDVSQLDTDDYLVRLTIKDDAGGVAQQVQRVSISNPRPTPTKTSQVEQTGRGAKDVVATVDSLTQTVRDAGAASYLVYGGAGLAGLVALVFVVAAVRYARGAQVRLEYQPSSNQKKSKPKPAQARASAYGKLQDPPTKPPMANIGPVRFERDRSGSYGVAELEEFEGTASDAVRSRVKPVGQAGLYLVRPDAGKSGELPIPPEFQPDDR
ncbi:MAG: M1 family metallopeptidase [Chloroflexi bacterium]|nr:M1 family metallopeptidase [Chloroflexota bacterium]